MDNSWVLLTILLTIFICWALQEIMERKLGMSPKIIKTDDIGSIINKRVTKSLDIKCEYRIQTRAAIYFIKCLWNIASLITFLILFSDYQWFMDHFVYLKPETVDNVLYQHLSACFAAYYLWEVIANRYGKLSWSTLLHHWFSAAMAVALCLGKYSPFATWYAFTVVTLIFPVGFMLGFRAHFSYKYPKWTRRGIAFSYYWYIFTMILNLCGQIFLIINSLLFHYNTSIHVGFIGVMMFCIFCWFYDDIQLLKGLRDFSTQHYEDADILSDAHDEMIKEDEVQSEDEIKNEEEEEYKISLQETDDIDGGHDGVTVSIQNY